MVSQRCYCKHLWILRSVDQYWITYDSAKEAAFLVHMKHKTVKFTCTSEGLYQFKVPNEYKDELKVKQEERTETSNMVHTVNDNKIIPKRQVE